MTDQVAAEWSDEDHHKSSRMERFRTILSRAESVYLELLRAVALFVATILLIWIGWLLASSAYNISRDADAVAETPVVVTASDVAAIELPAKGSGDPAANKSQGKSPAAMAFEKFRDGYFRL